MQLELIRAYAEVVHSSIIIRDALQQVFIVSPNVDCLNGR